MRKVSLKISIGIMIVFAFASTATLKAEEAQKQTSTLHARAMLIRMPADEFKEFEITDNELSFPGPVEIAKMLLLGHAEMLTSAKTSLVATEDGLMPNSKGENHYYVKYLVPIREKMKEGEVPVVNRYESYQDSCDFYFTSVNQVRLPQLAGKLDKGSEPASFIANYSFEYEWNEIVPLEEYNGYKGFKPNRDISDTFKFTSINTMSVEIDRTMIASYQKSKDSYLILLLNVSNN